jgi:hypothetical protein
MRFGGSDQSPKRVNVAVLKPCSETEIGTQSSSLADERRFRTQKMKLSRGSKIAWRKFLHPYREGMYM